MSTGMIQTLKILQPLLADIFCIEEEDVTPATTFEEDLAADEMDLVEVSMTVEEEFDLFIETETMAKFVTVGDLIAWILEHNND